MLRRTILTAAILPVTGAAASLPAEARVDPATFVDNLGRQLVVVVANPSRKRDRRNLAGSFTRSSMSTDSAGLSLGASRGP